MAGDKFYVIDQGL